MRTVVGIFWPSQSEMEGHIAAGMTPWTQAEFMTNLGHKLKDTIRDFTHKQLKLVGGGYLPGSPQNPSDLDFVWVGNVAGNPTFTCGTTNYPLNCGCGGLGGYLTFIRDWFNNNGYPDGWNNSSNQYVADGYDIKIAINLDCFTDDIGGKAGYDPLLSVTIDSTAGLSHTPPALLDMTNVVEVLGNPRVAQVTIHEIGHSIGYTHTSRYLGTFGGMPDCYAEPFPAPQYHCNKSGYTYNGKDDLCTMSYGGGAENRFGLYRESHFTAFKKFMMGKIPLPWGPHDIVNLEQFPPQCAHAPNITAGSTQVITLAAHDQFSDDPDMVANIANSTTMLLLIRRDIDASEAIDDINCEANPNDQLTPERYLGISYRRKAFWRSIGDDCPGQTCEACPGCVEEPQNGALIMDWGPLRAHGNFCNPNAGFYGTGVLAKMDATDTSTVWTLNAYTANGRSFPRIDIRIIQNDGHPGEIGPNSIRIEYKVS